MTVYQILPLIEVVFCLALLVVMIVKGRHHVAQKPFGIFLGFMTTWGVSIFLMRSAPSLSIANLWENFVFISILSAAQAFYWFTFSLTGTRPNKKIVIPLEIVAFSVMALVPTGLVFSGMQNMWYGKAPIIGHFFPLYVLCVYVPIVLGMVVLLKKFPFDPQYR